MRRSSSLRSDRASEWDQAPGWDGEASARREPAWLVDLTERIERAVAAIERISERADTVRANNSDLRAMTMDLREALQGERAQSDRRQAERDRSIMEPVHRASKADRSADTLAGMARDVASALLDRGERFRRAV